LTRIILKEELIIPIPITIIIEKKIEMSFSKVSYLLKELNLLMLEQPLLLLTKYWGLITLVLRKRSREIFSSTQSLKTLLTSLKMEGI
jgi:hypothetical protein